MKVISVAFLGVENVPMAVVDHSKDENMLFMYNGTNKVLLVQINTLLTEL